MKSGSSASICSGSQSFAMSSADLLVPPEVAAGLHRHLAAAALDHDHLLDRRALREGLVGVGLLRDRLAAAHRLVLGDDERGLAVLDAVAQRLRGEAAEDDAVDRADAGAGEHRDRQLGDHRQVDRDPVALLDAVLAQHVGEAADLRVQLLVGVGLVAAVVALPDDRGLVARARRARWRSRQL